MKNLRYNILSLLLAGGLLFPLLGGCVREPDSGGEPVETPVRFTVDLPEALSTRALTDVDQDSVQTIDVLVFEPDGLFLYKSGCNGREIVNVGSNRKTFSLRMRHGEYDLVMLANAGEWLAGAALSGRSRAQVLSALEAAMPADGRWNSDPSAADYRPIPMWGDAGRVTIDKSSATQPITGIYLTRMLARVDVRIAPAVTNFVLASVEVYNYNSRGMLAPAADNWNTATSATVLTPRATHPSLPAGSARVTGPAVYEGKTIQTTPASNACLGVIYLFEAENHVDADHMTAAAPLERTCIVVGGVYGTDTDTTYYRADFSTTSGTGGTEVFLDILRNHQYTFNITRVSGRGQKRSVDAFTGPTDLMSTTLEWNAVPIDNPIPPSYEISVDRIALTFDNTGAPGQELSFTASHEWSITTEDAAGGVADWILVAGTGGPQSGGAGSFARTITCTPHSDTSPRTGRIVLRTGNLTKIIAVTQQN